MDTLHAYKSLKTIPNTSVCFLQVLELDVMDVRIVEERTYSATIEMSSGSGESYIAHMPRKHFLYFTDEKIYFVLMEICRTLGTRVPLCIHESTLCLLSKLIKGRRKSNKNWSWTILYHEG